MVLIRDQSRKDTLNGFPLQSVQSCVNKCCCLVCFRLTDDSDRVMKVNDRKQAVPWWQCSPPYKHMLPLKFLFIWCVCETGWCLFFCLCCCQNGCWKQVCHECQLSLWSADRKLQLQERSQMWNKGKTYWRIRSTITCHWGENNQLKTDLTLILDYKAQEN